MREYVESLEEMSPSPSLGCAEGVSVPVRTSRASKDGQNGKDGQKSPSSTHSSTDLDRNVDHLFRISV